MAIVGFSYTTGDSSAVSGSLQTHTQIKNTDPEKNIYACITYIKHFSAT